MSTLLLAALVSLLEVSQLKQHVHQSFLGEDLGRHSDHGAHLNLLAHEAGDVHFVQLVEAR